MTYRIVFDTDRIRGFLNEAMHVDVCDNQTGIGIEKDGELIGGVIYYNYDGRNIWAHIRGKKGEYWLTKQFLKLMFYFPFVDADCQMIWGTVDYDNKDAQRLDEKLGFKRKAVLEGACWDGGDVYIYAMHKSECRYV